jgi:hypothetical protein
LETKNVIYRLIFVLLVLESSVIADSQEATEVRKHLIVGPNILVSQDGPFAHAEMMIAANPKDPNNLISVSMTYLGAESVRTYVSVDAGSSWLPTQFDGSADIKGDPQVAFDGDGEAYLVVMSMKKPEHLSVFRSGDGGKNWSFPVKLPVLDHPQIVVDNTNSQFRGSLYIWGLGTDKPNKDHEYVLSLYRSQDQGRTFSGPTAVVRRRQGASTCNPLVLQDGSLILPYYEFDFDRATGSYSSLRVSRLITSSDGGASFSTAREVARYSVPEGQQFARTRRERLVTSLDKSASPRLGVDFDFPRGPQFAADASDFAFKNRLYAVWTDAGGGSNSRVHFSFSRDVGKTWTAPRLLDATVPKTAYQYTPGLSVNYQGVLLVQWFDTRKSSHQNSYDLYCTASVDGGKSFVESKRITSKASFPGSIAHLAPVVVLMGGDKESLTVQYLTVYNTMASGGDYMNIASDATGVFHLLWADSRLGIFQVMTSAVSVGFKKAVDKSAMHLPIGADDIALLCEPAEYDPAKHQITIPVRIKNISSRSIHAPLFVEITSIDVTAVSGRFGIQAPLIKNAINGRTGVGALFSYSEALGDSGELAPGGVSGSVTFILKADSPAQANFQMKIRPVDGDSFMNSNRQRITRGREPKLGTF